MEIVIRNSIESGFGKGFVAIFDSNLTTLIITAILFVFGTGPIKGFAVTLALGTLASNVYCNNSNKSITF